MKASVRAQWTRTLLVCRKCSKRIGGGFGADGDERLARVLKRELAGGKRRKARVGVIEIGCVGICPKGAAVLIDAGAPGEWLIVRAGTPVAEIAARLGFAAEA